MAFSANLSPFGDLNFPGYTPLNINQMGYTGPMVNPASAVAAPAPAPVQSPMLSVPTISTSGTGSLDLSGITQADPLSQTVASALGTGVNADGTINQGGITGPQDSWIKSTFMNKDGGLNLGNITSILGTLGGLYGSFQQLGLAKDALNFQKDTYRENMGNQKKSYNTAVRDRADSRAAGLSWSDTQRDEYVNRNKL